MGAMPRLDCVLLLDEDPHNAEVLTTMLELVGYRVVVAPPEADAVAAARGVEADAVILNVTRPTPGGLAPIERLRAAAETAHVKILCLSGWVSEADRRSALAAGCDRFLAKPYRPDEVLTALRGLAAD
jgi:two-component system cell cycle response regulator DivK